MVCDIAGAARFLQKNYTKYECDLDCMQAAVIKYNLTEKQLNLALMTFEINNTMSFYSFCEAGI